jgi:hypothetical protein
VGCVCVFGGVTGAVTVGCGWDVVTGGAEFVVTGGGAAAVWVVVVVFALWTGALW